MERVDGPMRGLDVFHITEEVRDLSAGACQEQPVDTSTLSSQLPKPVAAEDHFVDLIGHLRPGDGSLPARHFREACLLVQ